ncbi:RecQ family ATP-dependent DNA helicase [Halocola ammonii]
MSENPLHILRDYWGYGSFRPSQEEIITHALEGRDTLALLPTGGGKSICFQVPAMCREGICIVISPLIALMKDQVENLKKKGIEAYAITSEMHYNEIDRALDNSIYGNTKFLYVSPERLKTDLFLERFKKMNVNLIAVDEAHCISQWGYDFRPPYLEIAEIRQWHPKVPVLALTATATEDVVQDIQEKLQFEKSNVVRKSFERKNLAYVVMQRDDKYNKLLEIVSKVKGSGIVYVGTRKRTREIAEFLLANKVSASWYHAGLKPEWKAKVQESWLKDETRIIVATNAFGMGIDKPDVRVVAHMDIPANIESYFQEAGRAGRDLNRAFCVMLWNDQDMDFLKKRHEDRFPEKEFIKTVYKSLGNYYSIAIGAGTGASREFRLDDFLKTYSLPAFKTFSSLKLLEMAGYLSLTEAVYSPSKVMFKIEQRALYSYQVSHPKIDPFITVLLRSYSGLFEYYTSIREDLLASRCKVDQKQIVKWLSELHDQKVLEYIPKSDSPRLSYTYERVHEDKLYLPADIFQNRQQREEIRLLGMIDYLNATDCRSRVLLRYFGETGAPHCGHCDVCTKAKKEGISPALWDEISGTLLEKIMTKKLRIDQLSSTFPEADPELLRKTIQWKIDSGELVVSDDEKLSLQNKF